MKAPTLVTGIVLLVLGAIGFVYAQTQIGDYQTFIGQFGRALSKEMQTQYQMLQYILLGSAAIGVTGIGLTIYGAVAKPR